MLRAAWATGHPRALASVARAAGCGDPASVARRIAGGAVREPPLLFPGGALPGPRDSVGYPDRMEQRGRDGIGPSGSSLDDPGFQKPRRRNYTIRRWQGAAFLVGLIAGGVVVLATDGRLGSAGAILVAWGLTALATALLALRKWFRRDRGASPADKYKRSGSGGPSLHHSTSARSWWAQPMNRSDSATVGVATAIAWISAFIDTAGYGWALINIFVSGLGIVLLVVAYLLSDRRRHDEDTRSA